MSDYSNDEAATIVEAVAERLGLKESKNQAQKLDEHQTTKVEEESQRRFSHASKTVWKMDQEA